MIARWCQWISTVSLPNHTIMTESNVDRCCAPTRSEFNKKEEENKKE
jgi:hypothetical protein